jgi:hypothetical protein
MKRQLDITPLPIQEPLFSLLVSDVVHWIMVLYYERMGDKLVDTYVLFRYLVGTDFPLNPIALITELNDIDLQNNDLLRLCSFIRTLDLQLNNIIEDTDIKVLTSLTSIDISFNKMITDEGLRSLTSLTSLNLYENESITDEGLRSLTNLTYLNLNINNMITKEVLLSLTSLTSIDIYSNRVITPNCISVLRSRGCKIIK